MHLDGRDNGTLPYKERGGEIEGRRWLAYKEAMRQFILVHTAHYYLQRKAR